MSALYLYERELLKWQKRTNLIGTNTLPNIWGRHFFDSAQLVGQLKLFDGEICDVGTGAGFPGLVLAVLGVPNITLVEKNARKVEFLKKVNRLIETKIKIIHTRVESLENFKTDLIIARAFAPLPKLLSICSVLLRTKGCFLLPKGKFFLRELTEAEKTWIMEVDQFPSKSDSDGVILKIKNLRLR